MSNYKELLNKIVENPDTWRTMTPEQQAEFKTKQSIFGVVTNDKDQWANLSIVNEHERYTRKIVTTAMIGFLYRLLEEYEAEPTKDQLREMAEMTGEEKDAYRAKLQTELDVEKRSVKKFLDRNFEYNPDRHLRESYTENKDDPERISRDEAFRKNMETGRGEATELTALKASETKEQLLLTYQTVLQLRDELDRLFKLDMASGQTQDSQFAPYLLRVENLIRDMGTAPQTLSAPDVTHAYVVKPPADVFHHFDRYFINHYEDLREAVRVLYAEKPDVDTMIQYIGSFDKPEDAEEDRKKHEAQFVTSVVTIKNGGWTVLGPFKQNREREEFYNKNTEVLRQMIKQQEADEKMGQELMKKRVERKKGENIIEAGPDDPNLTKYKAAMSTIETLGGKAALTDTERAELVEATKRVEDAQVPADAVQVDVFQTENGKLRRGKFYTEAAAPAPEMESKGPTVHGRGGKRIPLENLKKQ